MDLTTSSTMNEPLHGKQQRPPSSMALTAVSGDDDNSSELMTPAIPTLPPPHQLSHKATVVTDYSDSTVGDTVDPPPSRFELLRDKTLETLGGTISKCILVFVIFMVIADGAVFFFLLIGAHTLCDYPSRFNCEPRNEYYNYSIQILNVFITYLATLSFPWKLTHAIHLSPFSGRSCDVGMDLYGQPTEEIFFHIPPRRRRIIIGLLVTNSLAQFVNQSMRIRYYTFEKQSTWPGNLLTSGFFLTSFACAITAAIFQLRSESQIRREQPSRFAPGPLPVAKRYIRSVFCPRKKKKKNSEQQQQQQDEENDDVEEEEESSDPTEFFDEQQDERVAPFPEREEKERRRMYLGIGKWLQKEKTSLDVWGI